uniref:DUF177 domain-containing protein n=1 Tax=Oryza nivara TaxID=4536 RepID=A0A0E0GX36_ORYNI
MNKGEHNHMHPSPRVDDLLAAAEIDREKSSEKKKKSPDHPAHPSGSPPAGDRPAPRAPARRPSRAPARRCGIAHLRITQAISASAHRAVAPPAGDLARGGDSPPARAPRPPATRHGAAVDGRPSPVAPPRRLHPPAHGLTRHKPATPPPGATASTSTCAEPAPQGIFANFSLLLTEGRVEEPDVVDLGTIFEEEQTKAPVLTGSQEDGDDEDIDWDDRLHFPAGEKEIDISKHIRDIIHLEITLDALCSPTCKGLCVGCGENLNTSSCSCNTEKQQAKAKNVQRRGPLKDLLKPLQR